MLMIADIKLNRRHRLAQLGGQPITLGLLTSPTTFAPSSTNNRACAAPIPTAPPVITAALSQNGQRSTRAANAPTRPRPFIRHKAHRATQRARGLLVREP